MEMGAGVTMRARERSREERRERSIEERRRERWEERKVGRKRKES